MELVRALQAQKSKVITFVGAGGKTTTMFRLARELADDGRTVVVTTTTRILPPRDDQTDCLLTAQSADKLCTSVRSCLGRADVLTVAAALTSEGKLKGIESAWVAELATMDGIDHVLVEGDGSAQKPLTAPRAYEPVIPPCTELLVPVAGVDALGCALDARFVHRPEVIASLTGLEMGAAITPEVVATVMLNPRGNVKGAPRGCKIIPVVNKADDDQKVEQARSIARHLLASGARRVVIAASMQPDPVREIVSPPTRLALVERPPGAIRKRE